MPAFLRPMELSIIKVVDLVHRIERADWAIDDIGRGLNDVEKGVALLNEVKLFLEVGNNAGVVLVSSLIINRQAEVSVMVWDRKWMRRHIEGRQVLNWLMDAFNLNRIYGHVSITNQLARRFDEKIGMREVGILRNWYVRDGKPRDVYLMEMIREATP